MQDLWQSADTAAHNHADWRTLRRSQLVGWWWAAFIVAGLVGRGGTGGGNTLDSFRTSNEVALFAQVVLALAAVLGIFVVREITRRQDSARTQETHTPSTSPAEWHADPSGRFQYRYWNGNAWTTHVSSQGHATIDPLAMPGAMHA